MMLQSSWASATNSYRAHQRESPRGMLPVLVGPSSRASVEPNARQRASKSFGRMREPLATLAGSDSLGQGALGLPQGLLFPCRDELGQAAFAQQAHESIVVLPALDALNFGAQPRMGRHQDRALKSLRVARQQAEASREPSE